MPRVLEPDRKRRGSGTRGIFDPNGFYQRRTQDIGAFSRLAAGGDNVVIEKVGSPPVDNPGPNTTAAASSPITIQGNDGEGKEAARPRIKKRLKKKASKILNDDECFTLGATTKPSSKRPAPSATPNMAAAKLDNPSHPLVTPASCAPSAAILPQRMDENSDATGQQGSLPQMRSETTTQEAWHSPKPRAPLTAKKQPAVELSTFSEQDMTALKEQHRRELEEHNRRKDEEVQKWRTKCEGLEITIKQQQTTDFEGKSKEMISKAVESSVREEREKGQVKWNAEKEGLVNTIKLLRHELAESHRRLSKADLDKHNAISALHSKMKAMAPRIVEWSDTRKRCQVENEYQKIQLESRQQALDGLQLQLASQLAERENDRRVLEQRKNDLEKWERSLAAREQALAQKAQAGNPTSRRVHEGSDATFPVSKKAPPVGLHSRQTQKESQRKIDSKDDPNSIQSSQMEALPTSRKRIRSSVPVPSFEYEGIDLGAGRKKNKTRSAKRLRSNRSVLEQL